ncbi:hypothetical protein GCM10020001_104300 [Nonomuraea salmonea]
MGRDALLAGAVAILALTVSALDEWRRGSLAEITDVGAAAAWAAPILAVCAPLALRRRLPLTAVAASAMVMLVLGLALERDAGIWVLGLIVASAAYHRHRLRSVLLIGSVAWAVTAGLGGASVPDLATVPVHAAAGAMPVAAGYALRLRADRAVQAARLQHAREEQARSQEAARIAREVHDVVGHHLSAIRLQAVGARRALAGHDCEADRALAGIAGLSAEALAEIRALLATLVRPDREDHAHGKGLADLPALVQRSGGPELAVTLEVDPRLEGGGCAPRNRGLRLSDRAGGADQRGAALHGRAGLGHGPCGQQPGRRHHRRPRPAPAAGRRRCPQRRRAGPGGHARAGGGARRALPRRPARQDRLAGARQPARASPEGA